MKLKIGKMSTKELAEWFGISYGTFRNKKQEKLKELQEYAKYEEIYGGVNIQEIYIDEYEKNLTDIRKIYRKGFEEVMNKNGIDTIGDINEKIYYKYKQNLPTLTSAESGRHYATEVRNYGYNIPFKGMGKWGTCFYLWCKVDEEKREFIELTEEENKIKKELMTKHFGSDEERDIMIAQMVDNGEISEAEAYRMTREYRGLNNKGFLAFKADLEAKLGCKITRATKFEKGVVFEEEGQQMLFLNENSKN